MDIREKKVLEKPALRAYRVTITEVLTEFYSLDPYPVAPVESLYS